MGLLAITFLIPFVASLGLTVAVRAVALRLGIVDQPDGQRKLHAGPVALWGGVAVYLATVLGLAAAGFGSWGTGPELAELSAVLVAAAGVVCLFGAIDDCWYLSARSKLVLQVAAVLPIIAFGYWFDRVVVFGTPIELGWLGAPLTVVWLVGCINALNLLDGMDGLASTVGLLTAVMMAVIAAALGHPHVAVIAVVLAGALAGFLVHNLPPAKIFLGDSGSMVIGLIVGVLGIQGAMKTSATVAVTVPVVLMSLPILDSVLAIVRRKLTGRRFDTADREHIHHRLLDRGLSQWQALGLIGGLSLATGAAATAATVLRSDSLAWITVAVVFVGAVRLRLFGHHEVALAKGAVARRMAGWACQLAVPNSRSRIPSAARLERLPFDQSWPALVGLLRAWDVCRIELTLVAEGQYQRRQRWAAPAADLQPAERWSIAISCRQGDGRLCELRATGNQPLEPESACSAGLTRVLQVFAVHFSEHAEQIPGIGLAPVPSGPETSLETTSRTKAA